MIEIDESPILVSVPSDMPNIIQFVDKLLQVDEINKNVTIKIVGANCLDAEEAEIHECDGDCDNCNKHELLSYDDFKKMVYQEIKEAREEAHTMDLSNHKIHRTLLESQRDFFENYMNKFREEEPVLASYYELEYLTNKEYLMTMMDSLADIDDAMADLLININHDILQKMIDD